MEFYILFGKWGTFRCGVPETIERRILYLPDKNLRFSVDDREIRRKLSGVEEKSLNYLFNRIKESNKNIAFGSYRMYKLKLVKQEADENLVSKIIEAYNIKDIKFFFSL